MSEIVETQGARIELCEPWEAGKHDPPMQEWLQLPVGEDACPHCDSATWGTLNARGYFCVRICHDGNMVGCAGRFRGAVSPFMIQEVVGALCGQKRRFLMAYLKEGSDGP